MGINQIETEHTLNYKWRTDILNEVRGSKHDLQAQIPAVWTESRQENWIDSGSTKKYTGHDSLINYKEPYCQ